MFAIYAYTEDVSWTNIYHYDKDARTLNYETSPQIKDLVQDWYNPPMSLVNAVAFDPYTHGYYKVTERVGEAFKDGLQLKK